MMLELTSKHEVFGDDGNVQFLMWLKCNDVHVFIYIIFCVTSSFWVCFIYFLSNFYGRAVYYPNYGMHPPHNGREVRAAHHSWSTVDTTALSSLPLLQIDSLQIDWYCDEEHGQCL